MHDIAYKHHWRAFENDFSHISFDIALNNTYEL